MENRSTYDEKLAGILRSAAAVFAEKGYHRASIRDIARATGTSLSGLYYYVSSKEELLFLIQAHCFQTIVDHQEEVVAGSEDPAERLRELIRNHLRFFTANMDEMKVLSHEADVLTGEYRERITALKRRYTALVRTALEELRPEGSPQELRAATFSLFGMLNWIYNWYRPGKDLDADGMAELMAHLFLEGFLAAPGGAADESLPDEGAEPAASLWR